MPATQQDIANHLNLSRSLVGGVLSNHPRLRVSKETRWRVLQAAKEMGYRPNSVASNLRRGKTGVVTLAYRQDAAEVGQGLGPVMSSLAKGVVALDHEFHIRPFPSQDSLLAGLREIASRSQCDVIVLWVEHGGEAAAELLESLNFPFIIKGRYEERHPQWLQADFDHEAMMHVAVEYLRSNGHSRIGYIGPENIEDYSYFNHKGFMDAMRNAADNSDRWSIAVPEGPEVVDQIMTQMLSLPIEEQPTAMVIGASLAAWDGLEIALARHGRRLGVGHEDFAAVGGRHATPLMFGEAMAYDQVELSDIADHVTAMLKGILMPQGSQFGKIVRITPPLHRQASRRLPIGDFRSYAGLL